jgi:hypothetical protein
MARHRRRMRHNRKSRRHRKGHRLVANLFGSDLMRDVVTPVLGGTAGFMAARALGHLATEKLTFVNGDLRMGKAVAALVGIPATFVLAGYNPMVAKNSGAIVLGMGLAAAEAYLRNTPLLGGAPAAAAVTAPAAPPAGTSGFGAYYSEGSLGTMYATAGLGRGYDISHAGAPYKGMLGLGQTFYATAGLGDPGDQSAVEGQLDEMESISTIIPTDLALRAKNFPQVRPVDHPFAEGDKGYAGGTFARHLFSGMMGG